MAIFGSGTNTRIPVFAVRKNKRPPPRGECSIRLRSKVTASPSRNPEYLSNNTNALSRTAFSFAFFRAAYAGIAPRIVLMRMVAAPCIDRYERIFEIVERYATGENLFVRLHATVPLIELAKRRLLKVDAASRFMSDQLAVRVKNLALLMAEDNFEYPAVLEWVAHVMVCIPDFDHDTALNVINKLLTIAESEAASDISWIMIYFAIFRENQFKQLAPFKSEEIRSLLKDRLADGGEYFRASAANHFKILLERGEIGFDTTVPYLESLLDGEAKRVANYHLYAISAKYAASPQRLSDV